MIRRIFLATTAPPEISTFLEQLKADNQHLPGIKWMRYNNLHLTIYFIGNVNAENFNKILNVVTPIVRTHKKIVLDFEKTSFAPTQNPKMIWARFYKNNSFTQMVNSLHEALHSIIPENKFYFNEPIPHITLARFHPLKEFEKINIGRAVELAQIEITACDLMESIPSPTGVTYIKAASSIFFHQ